MLGLLLIYFIGRRFYDLAADYGKNKWGFAILGIVSYYAGSFIGGFLMAVGIELWSSTSVEEIGDLGLSIMAMPFGIIGCVGVYYLLRMYWQKNRPVYDEILDDAGMNNL